MGLFWWCACSGPIAASDTALVGVGGRHLAQRVADNVSVLALRHWLIVPQPYSLHTAHASVSLSAPDDSEPCNKTFTASFTNGMPDESAVWRMSTHLLPEGRGCSWLEFLESGDSIKHGSCAVCKSFQPDRRACILAAAQAHRVVLLRPCDLDIGVVQLLTPVREVAGHARDGKQHREELWRETHRPVHQSCTQTIPDIRLQ